MLPANLSPPLVTKDLDEQVQERVDRGGSVRFDHTVLRCLIIRRHAREHCQPRQRGANNGAESRNDHGRSDPDWIGPEVRDAYWSADARTVYCSIKRHVSPIIDLHRVDLAGHVDQIVDASAMSDADFPIVFNRFGARATLVRNGNIFVRAVSKTRLNKITRSTEAKSNSRCLRRDIDAPPPADDLHDIQLRTFSTLKKAHEDAEVVKQHGEELRKGDATRLMLPFYLGDDIRIVGTSMSPIGRRKLVVTEPKANL